MIIWINGPFGAGKSTLGESLRSLLPDSFIFDPEYIGFALDKLVPESPTGDFQDLPIWRSMTLHALTEVRRLYPQPVIVPMTLVAPVCLEEIIGGLVRSGQPIVHVFLDLPTETLEKRIRAQVMDPDPAQDAEIRSWRLAQVQRCLAARDAMPPGTVVLDSGSTAPADLAARVVELAAAVQTG